MRIEGKSAKRGEGRASPAPLGELFRQYAPEIIAHVRNRVGEGPPDADDIAQQTFAKFAGLGAQKRAEIDNPRAFLYRTATNLVTDYFRSATARTNVQMGDQNVEIFVDDRDELTPEIVLLARERYAAVMEAVARLPRRQRRFFILRRIKGWSIRKIAKENGVGVGTVCRDVEMALGACRVAMEGFEDDE